MMRFTTTPMMIPIKPDSGPIGICSLCDSNSAPMPMTLTIPAIAEDAMMVTFSASKWLHTNAVASVTIRAIANNTMLPLLKYFSFMIPFI